MSIEDKFYVAFVLGSSKISAVAGHKEADGAIKVLAYAQEPAGSFVRKGRVNNVNKMTACVSIMKEKLEKKLQKSIGSVYVGISGMGIHTQPNHVVKQFPEKITITQDIIEDMFNANQATSSSEREILDSVVQEYKLGTQQTADPVGIQSDNIEGRFLNIVGNASIREDIHNCFREAGLKVIGLPIAAQALADVVLNDSEKSSGCALVDIGAETTTVAVYKNKLLRHLAVLPLGGANVNRDITSLQIEDAEAEELKLKYGEAIYDIKENKRESITLNDGRNIPFLDFSSLVEARMEEIIKNIDNQIKLSKYDNNSLIGGIYLTGGGAEMRHLEKAFKEYTDFSTLKIKKEVNLQLRGSNVADLKKDPGYNIALAIIEQSTENCCAGDLGTSRDLFELEARRKEEEAREAERKAQEEAERLAQEEAERQAQEEEERRLKEERRRNNFWNKSKKTFQNWGKSLTELVSEEKEGESDDSQR